MKRFINKYFNKIVAFMLALVIFSLGLLPTINNNEINFNVVYAANSVEKKDNANLVERIISGLFLTGAVGVYALIGTVAKATITFETLIFNGYANTRLTFFDDITAVPKDEGAPIPTTDSNPYITSASDAINGCYSFFRSLAIIFYMIMLVFMEIRILLGVGARTKAKYQDLIMYWIQGILILFLFPYVMKYTILLNDSFVNFIYTNKSKIENLGDSVNLPSTPVSTSMSGIGSDPNQVSLELEASGKDDDKADYMSRMFYLALTEGWLVYAICFSVMVKQLLGLFVIYIKRVITLMFLIAIFPLVTISYAIDKIGDGKSQAFNNWYKEFVLNVFLQSFHAIVYVIGMALIFSLGKDVLNNWIFVVIVITFISKGDDMLRGIFHVEGGGGNTVKNIGSTLLQAKAVSTVVNKSRDMVSKNFGEDSKIRKGAAAMRNSIDATSIGLYNTMTSTANLNALNELQNSTPAPAASQSEDLYGIPAYTSVPADMQEQAEDPTYMEQAAIALDTTKSEEERMQALDNLNTMRADNEFAWNEFKNQYKSEHSEHELQELEALMDARAAMVALSAPNANVNLEEDLDLLINILRKGAPVQMLDKDGKPTGAYVWNKNKLAYEMLTKAGYTEEKLLAEKERLKKAQGMKFKKPEPKKRKTKRFTQPKRQAIGTTRYTGVEIPDDDEIETGSRSRKRRVPTQKRKQTYTQKIAENVRSTTREVKYTSKKKVRAMKRNAKQLAKDVGRSAFNYTMDVYAEGKYRGKKYAFNRAVRPVTRPVKRGIKAVAVGGETVIRAARAMPGRVSNTVRAVPGRVSSTVRAVPGQARRAKVSAMTALNRAQNRAKEVASSAKSTVKAMPRRVVYSASRARNMAVDNVKRVGNRAGDMVASARIGVGSTVAYAKKRAVEVASNARATVRMMPSRIKYTAVGAKDRVVDTAVGAKNKATSIINNRRELNKYESAAKNALKSRTGYISREEIENIPEVKALRQKREEFASKGIYFYGQGKTQRKINKQVRYNDYVDSQNVVNKRAVATSIRMMATGANRQAKLKEAERIEAEANELEQRIMASRRRTIKGHTNPANKNVQTKAQSNLEHGMRELTIQQTRQLRDRAKTIEKELNKARKDGDTALINQKVEELRAVHDAQAAVLKSISMTRQRLKENNIYLSFSGLKSRENRIDENYGAATRRLEESMSAVDRTLSNTQKESTERIMSVQEKIRVLAAHNDALRAETAEQAAKREETLAKFRNRLAEESRIHATIQDDRNVIDGIVQGINEATGNNYVTTGNLSATDSIRSGFDTLRNVFKIDTVDPNMSAAFLGRLDSQVAQMAASPVQSQDRMIINGIRTDIQEQAVPQREYNPNSDEVPEIIVRGADGAADTSGKNKFLEVNTEAEVKTLTGFITKMREEMKEAEKQAKRAGNAVDDSEGLNSSQVMSLATAIIIINGAAEGHYQVSDSLDAVKIIRKIMAVVTDVNSKEYREMQNLLANLHYDLDDFESNMRIQILNDPTLVSNDSTRNQVIEESRKYVINQIPKDDILLTMLDYDIDALRGGYVEVVPEQQIATNTIVTQQQSIQDMIRQATADVERNKAMVSDSIKGGLAGATQLVGGVAEAGASIIGALLGATITAGMTGGSDNGNLATIATGAFGVASGATKLTQLGEKAVGKVVEQPTVRKVVGGTANIVGHPVQTYKKATQKVGEAKEKYENVKSQFSDALETRRKAIENEKKGNNGGSNNT